MAPERISLIDTVRWLIGVEGDEDVSVLVINPARPGPRRAAGGKPKKNKPQSELRKLLPMKHF